MCNLSQGIRERGEARGEARGAAKGDTILISNMYRAGLPLEQIAQIVEKPL